MSAEVGAVVARAECASCGSVVPLPGFVDRATCPRCFEETVIPRAFWRDVLRELRGLLNTIEKHGAIARNKAVEGVRLSYELKPVAPHCEKCRQPLEHDSHQHGTQRNFPCPSCGDPASTQPGPDWLGTMVVQLFSVDPARVDGSAALAPNASRRLTLRLECPHCGAGLTRGQDTDRSFDCEFCSSVVYLTDEFWYRLHPLQKAQPCFARFESSVSHPAFMSLPPGMSPEKWAAMQQAVHVDGSGPPRAPRGAVARPPDPGSLGIVGYLVVAAPTLAGLAMAMAMPQLWMFPLVGAAVGVLIYKALDANLKR